MENLFESFLKKSRYLFVKSLIPRNFKFHINRSPELVREQKNVFGFAIFAKRSSGVTKIDGFVCKYLIKNNPKKYGTEVPSSNSRCDFLKESVSTKVALLIGVSFGQELKGTYF